MVMSLVGFEQVFRQAVIREVAPGTAIRMIPIPVLALLKIVSFLDSPSAREKDAQDILSILERYEMEGECRFGSEVYDAEVDYERAGAFLLGRDLAALCRETEAEWVARFVRVVQNDSTAEAMVFARATGRPAFEEHGENRRAIMRAFAAGFS
jgi:predicted nucleotidyltransferase